MDDKSTSRKQRLATAQALFVTFLWSTSWVLIKIGLEGIPPLTFAGLRYFVAFLILVPLYVRSESKTPIKSLKARQWGWLAGLGILYYAITQGSQFVGLQYLPAITFSLLLNFTAPIVAILGVLLLREKLTRVHWGGIAVFLVGVYIFFSPVIIPEGMVFGFLVAGVHVMATSISSIVGRFINRAGDLDALTVTVISMGIGSVILLGTGLIVEGVPALDVTDWLIVVWLAVVNTAFAFTLWNHTLRTLSAAQSSIINNTMLIQIAVLAWVFLGEEISGKEILGMGIVALGVLLVNMRRD